MMPVWLFVPFIFFIRMFGLFSLIPLIKPLLESLSLTVTPASISLLTFSYSLSQAIFQWPLSALSDKWGRLFIIRVGLLLFGIGSIIGLFSNSIVSLVIARVLQGSGAIGATAQAFLADSAKGEKFQLNFYLVGMAIVLSFGLSFLIAPVFSNYSEPKNIFLMIAVLTFVGLAGSYRVKEIKLSIPQEKDKMSFSTPIFLIFSASFMIHFLQSYLFGCYPLLVSDNPSLTYRNLFCYAFLLSLYPLAKRNFRLILIYCITAIIFFFIATAYLNQIINNKIYLYQYYILMIFFILLLLEATLPSLLTLYMKGKRGAMIGLYSTIQYLAMSFGGGAVAYAAYPVAVFGVQCIFYALLMPALWCIYNRRSDE